MEVEDDLQMALCLGLNTARHWALTVTGVKITTTCLSSCVCLQDELLMS